MCSIFLYFFCSSLYTKLYGFEQWPGAVRGMRRRGNWLSLSLYDLRRLQGMFPLKFNIYYGWSHLILYYVFFTHSRTGLLSENNSETVELLLQGQRRLCHRQAFEESVPKMSLQEVHRCWNGLRS